MSDRQSPASVEAEQRAEIASLVPLLRAQNEDLRRIAQLVKETDNVSKDVLREANSLGTGARNPVKTVEHATVMIGARRVYQLAMRRLRQMKAPIEQLLRSAEAPDPAPAAEERSPAAGSTAEGSTV